MTFVRTFLMGLLALPLAAQSTNFSVGGSVLLGLDSYKKAVNSNLGFMIDGGWETTLLKSGVPARVTLGAAFMPGKDLNGLKTSLTDIQLAGDILLDTGVERLRGLFGISLNRYTARYSGEESTSLFDVDHHFPFHDVNGIKGGLRLGLEYAFTSRLAGQVIFQNTELSGRERSDPLIRKGAVNPAWIQFEGRYRF